MNPEEKIDRPSISLGAVLSKTFSSLKMRPSFFLGLPLLAALPYAGAMAMPGGSTLLSILSGALELFGQGAVAYAVFQALKGEKVSIEESLDRCFSRTLSILGIIIMLGILFGLLSLLLGVILNSVSPVFFGEAEFLITTIMMLFFVRFALAVPICVVEGQRASESISRSMDLSGGNGLKMAALLFFILLIRVVLYVLIGAIVGMMTDLAPAIEFFAALSIFFSTSLIWVVFSVVYFELRRLKEGLDLESLAEIFN